MYLAAKHIVNHHQVNIYLTIQFLRFRLLHQKSLNSCGRLFYDFIFENKLRHYTEKNILQLKVSFSRASATTVEKIHKEMLLTGKLQNIKLMAKSYVSHFIQNDAGKLFEPTLPNSISPFDLFQYRHIF